MGRILSVNTARKRELLQQGKTIETGIFKEPASAAVSIGPLGLASDHVHDRRFHGGPARPVHAYPPEVARGWEEHPGKPLAPGTFGENLTLEGCDLSSARAGDVLAAG